jgi:hypothetical protein
VRFRSKTSEDASIYLVGTRLATIGEVVLCSRFLLPSGTWKIFANPHASGSRPVRSVFTSRSAGEKSTRCLNRNPRKLDIDLIKLIDFAASC